MTTIKNNLGLVGVCAAILLTALLLITYRSEPAYGSTFPVAPAIATATTTGSVSVTSSTRVLASTTNVLAAPGIGSFNRAYATICNPNANPVYINLDGDKPASKSAATYVIAAAAGYNACFELTDVQLDYNGSITASSTAETATVITYKDYVY